MTGREHERKKDRVISSADGRNSSTPWTTFGSICRFHFLEPSWRRRGVPASSEISKQQSSAQKLHLCDTFVADAKCSPRNYEVKRKLQ